MNPMKLNFEHPAGKPLPFYGSALIAPGSGSLMSRLAVLAIIAFILISGKVFAEEVKIDDAKYVHEKRLFKLKGKAGDGE